MNLAYNEIVRTRNDAMGLKCVLTLSLCLLLAVPALAQQDTPTVDLIFYDDVVEGDLTQEAFYDWWQLQAEEGDVIAVDMVASDGLAPLLGILNPSGDLVARSDSDGDAEINGTVSLEYTAAVSGQHTIVPTRVGNLDGTTTGHYALQVRRANPVTTFVNPYQQVVFPCEGFEATTVATLEFAEDPEQASSYRITVYGLDGLEPVIRINIETPEPFELCNMNADRTVGDTFTLPGDETRTVQENQLNTVSQLILNGAEQMGTVRVTLGSVNGAPGRYMAILEGFNIADRLDRDFLTARIGPLAAQSTSLLVYMVAAENSRVDPQVELLDAAVVCDDAGRRGCEDVPSFDGAGATIHEGEGTTIRGDRFEAGLRLAPANPDPLAIELRSFNGSTTGDYAIVVIGELPPRPG
jgi:hypothetical protein